MFKYFIFHHIHLTIITSTTAFINITISIITNQFYQNYTISVQTHLKMKKKNTARAFITNTVNPICTELLIIQKTCLKFI